MYLGSEGENQFLLTIKGYQFPGNLKNEFDANWLMIGIAVKTPQWQWEKEDPAMLTWEVQSLIDWLEAVALAQEEWNCVNFTEPNLSFCIRGRDRDLITLGVHLALEFRPHVAVGDREVTVEVTCTMTELAQWIAYLKAQLANYPLQVIVNEEM